MTDQYLDDKELSELVRQAIADELAKRARAEKPEGFFEGKTHEWLDTSIPDQDEEEPENAEDQAERWLEMDRKPQLNTWGMPIETPDEVWDRARGGRKIIEESQAEITDIFERWMSELEDE